MPPAIIAAGVGAVGSIGGALIAGHSAKKAANAQGDAAQLGIDEQRREFDQSRSDLLPWLNAGQSALGGLLDITGLHGGAAQQTAINGIQASPQFASLNRQGEEAILQNSAATGGLRGGNIQSSLYNQRSDLLAQLIDQQFARLGGISGAGAQTGAQLGSLGAGAANAISGLFGQQGAARAGGIMAGGQALSGALSGGLGLLGSILGGGGGGIGAASLGPMAVSPGLLNPQPLSSVPVNWGF